jgi:hypothetical protein
LPYDLFIPFFVFFVGTMLKPDGVLFDDAVFGFGYPLRLGNIILTVNLLSIDSAVGILLVTLTGHSSHPVDPKK